MATVQQLVKEEKKINESKKSYEEIMFQYNTTEYEEYLDVLEGNCGSGLVWFWKCIYHSGIESKTLQESITR